MNLDPFYSNPANAAMPYLQQIPGTITPYFQPYINAGSDSLNTLIKQYQTLLNNPGQIISSAGAGYQKSPGYQFQYNEGMNGANAAAAAGGTLGTPEHQQEAASLSSNLANQDYQKYLEQALGLYGEGLKGEQGINQMGFKASTNLAEDLASNLASEGSLAFQGAEGQNAANGSMVKLASMAAGGLLGGVPGAAAMGGIPGYGNSGGSLGGSNNNPAFISSLASLLSQLGPEIFTAGSFFA
jgi:hypothetical protein